jgi:hypothetical protein
MAEDARPTSLRQRLVEAFGVRQRTYAEPIPQRPCPMPTDATQGQRVGADRRRSTASDSVSDEFHLEPRSADEHATELLRWLRGDGGRTGILPARFVMLAYEEMCAELRWDRRGWGAIARELRRQLGQRKAYAYVDGNRTVVYSISAAPLRALRSTQENRAMPRMAAA